VTSDFDHPSLWDTLQPNGFRYGVDWGNRVHKLAAGASTQEVLPFTGLSRPQGVAVGAVGAGFRSG